jgi:hypothetical protein
VRNDGSTHQVAKTDTPDTARRSETGEQVEKLLRHHETCYLIPQCQNSEAAVEDYEVTGFQLLREVIFSRTLKGL